MAGLTKQHFKAIAQILNNVFIEASKTENNPIKLGRVETITNINKQLCEYFKTQNPQFNAVLFTNAVLQNE